MPPILFHRDLLLPIGHGKTTLSPTSTTKWISTANMILCMLLKHGIISQYWIHFIFSHTSSLQSKQCTVLSTAFLIICSKETDGDKQMVFRKYLGIHRL